MPKMVGYKFLLFNRLISTDVNYRNCFQVEKEKGHSEDGVWDRGLILILLHTTLLAMSPTIIRAYLPNWLHILSSILTHFIF